jgi:hypothetical protein
MAKSLKKFHTCGTNGENGHFEQRCDVCRTPTPRTKHTFTFPRVYENPFSESTCTCIDCQDNVPTLLQRGDTKKGLLLKEDDDDSKRRLPTVLERTSTKTDLFENKPVATAKRNCILL